MQNHFLNQKEPLLRRRLRPLTQSQLDNIPSTSKGIISVSVSSSISGCNSWHLVEEALLEEPGFSGWAKPKESASTRVTSPKVDPDYNTKAKIGAAPSGMMTRSQLKRDRAMLLERPPAVQEPNEPKPEPKPQTSALRRFRTGKKLMPTVWHSGEVCDHALREICKPESMKASGNEVERWRAIETICLDLRGINVRGDVGVLKGPVSFEDVFQVLGLDEQGEPQVNPTPLSEVKVESSGKAMEVDSSGECFDIEKFLMPPLVPIQGVTLSAKKPRVLGLPKEPKSLTKSSRKRTTKSTKSNRRR